MAKSRTREILMCALFAALIAISTMVIQIPSPVSGYVNLGDVFVLFGAFALGPLYGAIAAGLGSAMADIILGYVIYAPATLIIKSVMAICAFVVFAALKKCIKSTAIAVMLAGIIAELIMVVGYFLYACLIMGEGLGAFASVPGNLVQGAIGIIASTILVTVLINTDIFNKNRK